MLTASLQQSVAAPGWKSRPLWLNVVSHLDPYYGGISAALPPLCRAVTSTGQARAMILAFCAPGEDTKGVDDVLLTKLPGGFRRWCLSRNLREVLAETVRQSAGLHIHGIWQEHCYFGSRLAHSLQKPYVISAHGMLEPWALRNKAWKKVVYSALVEKRNLGGAGCLHALTNNEATDYRRWGAKAPIAVIPNGVSLPSAVSDEIFFTKYPRLRGKELVLFLGRLHFKKGLDVLCRAWQESNRLVNSHLVLAGPDFDGTRAIAEKMVSEFGISSSVTFTGMLSADEKWSALAASQLFVLPSRSEGLSVSILEAMGMRLPVIVSERCNIPEIRTAGAGWVVRPQVAELRGALNDFFSSSESDRKHLGCCGNRLVRSRYNWTRIGEQISALYMWLQGSAPASDLDLRMC